MKDIRNKQHNIQHFSDYLNQSKINICLLMKWMKRAESTDEIC